MAYKRRNYKKKNTATFKKKVLKVVKGVAETKHHKLEKTIQCTPIELGTPLAPLVACYDNIITGTIDEGIPINSGGYGMTGESIYLIGIRLEIAYDNTIDTQAGPVYITTLVVHNKNDQNLYGSLFNNYGNSIGTASGLTATNARRLEGSHTDLIDIDAVPGEDADGHRQLDPAPTPQNTLADADVYVHSAPINKNDYTVLHRSALRLGCKKQPDMPGPRYHQRIVYIPLNKKVQCIGTKIHNEPNSNPPKAIVDEMSATYRIHVAFILTNPTAVAISDPVKIKFKAVLLYKDF